MAKSVTMDTKYYMYIYSKILVLLISHFCSCEHILMFLNAKIICRKSSRQNSTCSFCEWMRHHHRKSLICHFRILLKACTNSLPLGTHSHGWFFGKQTWFALFTQPLVWAPAGTFDKKKKSFNISLCEIISLSPHIPNLRHMIQSFVLYKTVEFHKAPF